MNQKLVTRRTQGDANKNYVKQVTRLRKAAKTLNSELWRALANQHIFDALPRRYSDELSRHSGEATRLIWDSEGLNIFVAQVELDGIDPDYQLARLQCELDALHAAVDTMAVAAPPQFPGRPPTHLEQLVCDLYGIVAPLVPADGERRQTLSVVEELLSLIGEKKSQKRLENISPART